MPRTNLFRRTLVTLVTVAAVLASTSTSAAPKPTLVSGRNGVAVSVSAPASKIGVDVLKRGGTAVDAAVAMALAMAVTCPEAGNIGGGGFMMVHPGDGQPPICVEYRETAPGLARKDTFSLTDNRLGHKVVGVPGTLRGLELAHKTYGKLAWRELVLPAVKLARDGFAVDRAVAESLNRYLGYESSKPFDEFRRVFSHPDARKWKVGDILIQPDLARTLELVANNGANEFYTGATAKKLVDEIKRGGGLIRLDDLAKYRANIRKPVHGTFHGFDVYGPPPPSSGGICLVEMLNILEQFPLKRMGRWSADTSHLMVEAMRRAYLDRARHLGDADFVDIPPHLVTKAYAKQLADEIDLNTATKSEELASDIPLADEPPSTTHFSVVDKNGMAVSNTYTLEQSYGSRVVVKGAGFLLNNEMGDFNPIPGRTTRTGLIGTTPNLVRPEQRMLSSMSPAILARDGRPVMAIGSPGGRTIINTVLQVILNYVDFGMDVAQAVEAPRIHHQWLPDRTSFERIGISPDTIRLYQMMGHEVYFRGSQGHAHGVSIDYATGLRYGAADSRAYDGRAVGY